MNQMSFGDAGYAAKRKKTRRELFLEEMEIVVPWKSLLDLIEPLYPVAGNGRRPSPLEKMLRVHLMQNWFGLSDPAMEEALYEITPMRAFVRMSSTFRVIKRQFGLLKVRFRGLTKNTAHVITLFALGNLWLARKRLLAMTGAVRPQLAK